VASLGLVSPGAVTDGVTLFFVKKTYYLFSCFKRHQKVMTLFSYSHHCRPLGLPTDRFSSTLCKILPKNCDIHQGVILRSP